MTTRPSGSRVVLGYQRPSFILPWKAHFSVQGSKIQIESRPRKFPLVPLGMLPPTTSTRPSASCVWPAHQMFSPGVSMRLPVRVTGSQSVPMLVFSVVP